MARASSTTADPAAEAAALLRRIGFGTLFLIVPTAGLVTRRGVVVLVPIGVFLLVIAAALDGMHRPLAPTGRRILMSGAAIAGAVVLLWCALSLLWTPFPAPAAERLLNILATVAIAIAGYLALPDRMRSANLYLVPIGVGLGALIAILLQLFGSRTAQALGETAQNIDRGLTVLVLMVWAGVAWLRSRGRRLEALLLALGVTAAALLGPLPMPAIALVAGAAVFALTAVLGPTGVAIAGGIMAGLLALAPLIPFAIRPLAGVLLQQPDPLLGAIRIWRSVVVSEPVRLVTGHGLETALRGRLEGLLPINAPTTILFELWYELGVIGAFAGAAALFMAIVASGRNHAALVPGMAAAFAAAYAFACLGIGTAQMWWFTALALLVLVFVSIERGQFRTTRPKARLSLAAKDA